MADPIVNPVDPFNKKTDGDLSGGKSSDNPVASSTPNVIPGQSDSGLPPVQVSSQQQQQPVVQVPSSQPQPVDDKSSMSDDLVKKPEEVAETGQGGPTVTVPPVSQTVSDMAKPVEPPAVKPGTDDKLAPLAPQSEQQQDTGVSGTSDETKTASTDLPAIQPMGVPGQPASSMSGGDMPTGATAPGSTGSASIPPISDSVSPSSSTTQVPVAPSASLAQTTSSVVPQMPNNVGGTDEELKKTHEPIFVMPDRLEMGQVVTIKVKVGMIPHVMEEAHYIQSIELLANDKSIGKVALNPKDNPVPEADFQVALAAGMQLKAVAYCNVHGKWESVRAV